MIAFLTGFVAAGVILYAAYLAIYGRKKVSANDIEVQRLKSDSPELPDSCAEALYPWHLAPDWAVCAATDRSGRSFWCDQETRVQSRDGFGFWIPVGFCEWKQIKNFTLPPHINWKDSKEMRP